ncbi:MAG: hypothetical protein WD942_04815 [Dehalococcoidia bacterium]
MIRAQPLEPTHIAMVIGEYQSSDTLVVSRLDGYPYTAVFRPNLREISRRQRLRIGAITATDDLHSAWMRQHDKGGNLVADPHDHAGYSPPGEIVALASARQSPDDAIRASHRIPPIYRRIAVWNESEDSTSHLESAERAGIGVIVLAAGSVTAHIAPRPPVPGKPAVFRWYVAELIYRSWLQAKKVHASS